MDLLAAAVFVGAVALIATVSGPKLVGERRLLRAP